MSRVDSSGVTEVLEFAVEGEVDSSNGFKFSDINGERRAIENSVERKVHERLMDVDSVNADLHLKGANGEWAGRVTLSSVTTKVGDRDAHERLVERKLVKVLEESFEEAAGGNGARCRAKVYVISRTPWWKRFQGKEFLDSPRTMLAMPRFLFVLTLVNVFLFLGGGLFELSELAGLKNRNEEARTLQDSSRVRLARTSRDLQAAASEFTELRATYADPKKFFDTLKGDLLNEVQQNIDALHADVGAGRKRLSTATAEIDALQYRTGVVRNTLADSLQRQAEKSSAVFDSAMSAENSRLGGVRRDLNVLVGEMAATRESVADSIQRQAAAATHQFATVMEGEEAKLGAIQTGVTSLTDTVTELHAGVLTASNKLQKAKDMLRDDRITIREVFSYGDWSVRVALLILLLIVVVAPLFIWRSTHNCRVRYEELLDNMGGER